MGRCIGRQQSQCPSCSVMADLMFRQTITFRATMLPIYTTKLPCYYNYCQIAQINQSDQRVTTNKTHRPTSPHSQTTMCRTVRYTYSRCTHDADTTFHWNKYCELALNSSPYKPCHDLEVTKVQQVYMKDFCPACMLTRRNFQSKEYSTYKAEGLARRLAEPKAFR